MNEEEAGLGLEGGLGLDGPPTFSSARFPWPPAEGESGLDALSRTWQQSMLQPKQFFSALPEDNPVQPAMLYALIMTLAAVLMSAFWAYVIPMVLKLPLIDPESVDPSVLMEHPLQYFLTATRPSLAHLLMAPLWTLLGLVVGAAFIHLLVLMFMRDHGPFSRTLCTTCYTQSAALFAIVPLAGVLISMVWRTVTTVIGLREAHRSTTGRAVAVVAAPLGCIVIAGILFAVLAVTMSGMLKP